MVRQINTKKVPPLTLLGHVSLGQFDHIILSLPDADVDDYFVAEAVSYPRGTIYHSLSPKVPCWLPPSLRWFDGLTTEEISDTTLELLLQNERRSGSPFSILKISFKLGNTVVQIQLGKDRTIEMWCGDGPWEEKRGEVYDTVLQECYISAWDSFECEVRDSPPPSNWLKCNKQTKKKNQKKTKHQHH